MAEREPHETLRKPEVDEQADLRRLFVATLKADAARAARAIASGATEAEALALGRVSLAPFAALRCGAKNRSGNPCRRRDLYRSGRCPLHGGLSTGPRTDAGKAKSATNGRRTP